VVRNPEGLSAKEKDNLCGKYTGAVVRVGAHCVPFHCLALFLGLKGPIEGVNRFEEPQTSSAGMTGSRTQLAVSHK